MADQRGRVRDDVTEATLKKPTSVTAAIALIKASRDEGEINRADDDLS